MLNEPALKRKLDEVMPLRELIGASETTLRRLSTAWELGATAWSEPHPFIALLFTDRYRYVREALERQLPALALTARQTKLFRQRIVTENRAAHHDVAAAIAELYVACRLHAHGASVELDTPSTGGKSPDIRAHRGATVTLEITGAHESVKSKAESDADVAAFNQWPRGAPAPERIRGRAGGSHGTRFLEREVSAFGDGERKTMIDRLARKLRDKANRGQLSGSADAVLVVSYWQVFGPSVGDLETAILPDGTGVLRAATFGDVGDVICDGERFEGAPIVTWAQKEPGVLVAPGDANAVLWLFNDGSSALTQRAAAPLSSGARQILVDAFQPALIT